MVDELTETTGKLNKESVDQGIINTVTGLFGGMGGLRNGGTKYHVADDKLA